MIDNVLIPAFWETCKHLVVLIVPITAITITIRLFFAGLYGGNRRD